MCASFLCRSSSKLCSCVSARPILWLQKSAEGISFTFSYFRNNRYQGKHYNTKVVASGCDKKLVKNNRRLGIFLVTQLQPLNHRGQIHHEYADVVNFSSPNKRGYFFNRFALLRDREFCNDYVFRPFFCVSMLAFARTIIYSSSKKCFLTPA